MPDYSILTDQELAARLHTGDQQAYAQLYNRHFRLLYVHALKRLRNEEQAKDIIQEFFTELWAKRQQLSLSESVTGYFFSSVNNRIVNYFLREGVRSRYIESFSTFLDRYSEAADHLVRERQLLLLIDKEVQALPPKMRAIFELSRKGHLTHKQIADQLSLSEKTVDRQISNALLRLRRRLGVAAFLLLLANY